MKRKGSEHGYQSKSQRSHINIWMFISQYEHVSPLTKVEEGRILRPLTVASAKKKTTSGAGEREKLKIQEAPPLL